MTPQTIESRVESLEKRVTQLEQLPARIDQLGSPIAHHTEMRAEFSAVRIEEAAWGEAITNMLRTEMATQAETLRQEFRTGMDGLATQMRVFHEEVISRIVLLREVWPPPTRPSRKKK